MSPQRQQLIARHLPDDMHVQNGEGALLPPLMRWLVATGRVKTRTKVAYEVPWLGRRVDLALLTSRGLATAFELKIGRLGRVLEQAAYNRSSFHRSWIVTGNAPRDEGLEWATRLGIGVLVVKNCDVISVAAHAPPGRPNSAAVRRLRPVIAARATVEF